MSYRGGRITDDQSATAPREYRCMAHGCTNAGGVFDHGEQLQGKCFWHFKAPISDWQRVTQQIRATPAMGNHGNVPTETTRLVLDMRSRMRE